MTDKPIKKFHSGSKLPNIVFRAAHNAKMQVNQDLSSLNLKWSPFTELKDYKSGWLLAVEMVKKFKIRNILHNTTNLPYINVESYNWMLKVIIPQLIDAEVKKVCRVVAPEPLTTLISDKYLLRINHACQNSPCKCVFFTKEGEAIKWLISPD